MRSTRKFSSDVFHLMASDPWQSYHRSKILNLLRAYYIGTKNIYALKIQIGRILNYQDKTDKSDLLCVALHQMTKADKNK